MSVRANATPLSDLLVDSVILTEQKSPLLRPSDLGKFTLMFPSVLPWYQSGDLLLS